MKKLFLLLAIMGIVVIGCTKEEADKGNDNNNNKTEQPDENGGGSEDGVPENIFFCLDFRIPFAIALFHLCNIPKSTMKH